MGIPARLGSYEVESLLGAGGMGEVYRARDTRLGRSIALKVLPEAFARDPDRVARLEREARVLASLNHSNIATLHGMEECDGTHFLVMELVDGETLAERLKRGPIPVEEALRIGHQIVDALETAHEKGIVHRDLKPANVKITPDDKVKVLDFGLAKAMDSAPATANLSNSPTLSLAATQAGMILGTAAYMSPEQAKGMDADARSDVFSFGCVLYEMLTGRQAFQGESVSEILAAVLIREPDLSGLPSNLNPRLPEILRRCLEKIPKRRWQAIGDLRVEIETIAAAPRVSSALEPAATQKPPLWKRAIPLLATALVFSLVAGLAGWSLRQPPRGQVARFAISVPEDQPLAAVQRHLLAISPDSSKLAYAARGQLFLRQLSELEARPIQGTATNATFPFFSPDGQWVGFFSNQESAFKKIAITGGAPVTICKVANIPLGASWYGDQIVFADSVKGIMRVSSNGGEPEIVSSATEQDRTAAYPQILDGGRVMLYTQAPFAASSRSQTESWDQSEIVAQQLGSTQRKVLIRGGSDARYVSSGHILYALGGNVLAVPFDLKTLEVKGGAVPVIEGVLRAPTGQTGVAHFATSNNGTLVYFPGGAGISGLTRTLALSDRSGKIQPLPLTPAAYELPRVSPDGKRLAVGIVDGKEGAVWIYEFSTGASARRLTFGGNSTNPLWSSDGRFIFFWSDRDGKIGIFRQLADGTGAAERLSTADQNDVRHFPLALDPSGKMMLFEFRHATAGESDIWIFPIDGDRKPRPLLEMRRFQSHAAFSPDGKWFTYMSNEQEASRPEIYVEPYPRSGAKYQITTDGGGEPLWSPDGKQIFYYWNSKIYAVDVRNDQGFSFGKAAALPINGAIQATGTPRNYDVTPDGKQFLVVLPASPTEANRTPMVQINVVLNWNEELKQRVPVK